MAKKMHFSARQEMLTSIKQQYTQADWKTKDYLLDGFINKTSNVN